MNDTTTRRAYAEGLRILAAALDADAALPLPYHGNDAATPELIFPGGREAFHAYVRLMDDAPATEHKPNMPYDFEATGRIAGLHVCVCARAADVADQVVVGQEMVDKVEWRLPPLPSRTGLEALLAAVDATDTDTTSEVTS